MLNSAELAQLSWAWKKFQTFCQYFKIYKQSNFYAQLSWAWKKFYNRGVSWGPRLNLSQIPTLIRSSEKGEMLDM